MKNTKRLLALAVSAAIAAPMAAHATNGMNLESYGPIAGGMGGASMAYDNGTAAVMNNPATLGLMDEGNRVDVAIGNLRPNVTTTINNTDYDSTSDSFLMPALGWAKKSGKMAYGVGVFSQGGMGTEYGATAPGGALSSGWIQTPGATALGGLMPNHQGVDALVGGSVFSATGPITVAEVGAAAEAYEERSEVGVGRLLVPFTYDVNEKVVVGGSIDYVWAGMDLQMLMSGAMMADMMLNPSSSFGSIGGTIPAAFQGMLHNGGADFGVATLNYGYFDFTDGSPYKGEAKGTGYAGKIGGTFKVNEKLTVGATYHSKTSLSDLEADGANVTMSFDLLNTTGAPVLGGMLPNNSALVADLKLKGNMKVNDFQWPATFALGMAYEPSDKLLLAADVKRINWADVMESFKMTFTADNSASNDYSGMLPGMDLRGQTIVAEMSQDWKDQTVIQLGASYMVTNATTLRVGYNYASNPIPDDKMNYLFPAITEKHYTFGAGHAFNDAQSVDFALSYVPEVTGGGVNGFETSMSQMNWQMMYSQKF